MPTIYALETVVGDERLVTRYRVEDNQRITVLGEHAEPLSVEAAREHARMRIGFADTHTWTEFTVRDLPTKRVRSRQDRYFSRKTARAVALDKATS